MNIYPCANCNKNILATIRICPYCGKNNSAKASIAAPGSTNNINPNIAPIHISTNKTKNNSNSSIQSISNLITGTIGLDHIYGFSLKRLFSEVLIRHQPGSIEKLFTCGSKSTTPILNINMSIAPSPWIFFRTLVASLIAYFIFVICWNNYENVIVLPGLILTGSFAVPISVLIFFFEINTPRNISMLVLLTLLILGGALSLLLTHILSDLTPFLNGIGHSSAGIIEETGKLITVITAMKFMDEKRYRYKLNYLLLGASVGAGFAGFESAGYALKYYLSSNEEVLHIITIRGIMAPFAHVAWTAISSSAYFIAKNETTTNESPFSKSKFWILFSVPILLHCLWNSKLIISFGLGFFGIGFVAWIILISLIQSGFKEIITLTSHKP